MKKIITLAFALLFCVMNGACLTANLHGKNAKKESFDEEVRSFMVTADQQQLVIIGQRHHYIFPLDAELKDILRWSGRSKLTARNFNFVISRGSKINGTYALEILDTSALSTEAINFINAHSFKEIKTPEHTLYSYAGKFSNGKVYSADKFKLPNAQTFNQAYTLRVSYDYASVGQVAGKILLTPLAVIGDSVMIVGGTGAAIILSPVLLLAQ